MDIGKAFSFVFEDKDWVSKILIAAAISLVGMLFGILIIPGILAVALLSGYTVEIARRVIHDDPQVLPEWDNWGALITDGLKFIVISIVYAAPMILASICLGIPAGLLSEDSPDLSTALSLVLSCINILWAIVLSLFVPAAVGAFAAENDLGAAFRFGRVFSLVRNNFSTYLIVLVMSWIAELLGGLGVIICLIGLLATYPYSYMVIGHLYGQAYRKATGQVPAAVPESW